MWRGMGGWWAGNAWGAFPAQTCCRRARKQSFTSKCCPQSFVQYSWNEFEAIFRRLLSIFGFSDKRKARRTSEASKSSPQVKWEPVGPSENQFFKNMTNHQLVMKSLRSRPTKELSVGHPFFRDRAPWRRTISTQRNQDQQTARILRLRWNLLVFKIGVHKLHKRFVVGLRKVHNWFQLVFIGFLKGIYYVEDRFISAL